MKRKLLANRHTIKLLSATACGLGIFGILHQGITGSHWWSWPQFKHHESLIAMCFVSAVSLLVGEYAATKRQTRG